MVTVISTDNIISANSLENLENIEKISEKIKEDPGILKNYLSQLPEKALHLGIKIVIAIIVFLVCRKLIKLLTKILDITLTKAGAAKTAITFLDTLINFTLTFILVMGIFIAFGLNATSAVAILGSLGVTIGLALQDTLSNFAGGVLLLILRPFGAGDYIEEPAAGIRGTVESVTIFYTIIKTDNNFEASIPNGKLSNNNIINYSRLPVRRLIQTYDISYHDDIKKVKEILLELVRQEEKVFEDEKNPAEVYVKELSDHSIVMGVRALVKTSSYLDFLRVGWHLNEAVKLRFDQEGIEIPFPQIDVHNKQQD